MANSINNDPIIIDSTGTIVEAKQSLTLVTLVWNGYASGDALVLKNASGSRTILELDATVAGNPIIIPFSNGFICNDGLSVTTIGGGKVFLFCGGR